MESEYDQARYLLSIPSVRERTSIVFEKAIAKGSSTNFEVNLSQVDSVVDFVCKLINRDYGNRYSTIPPHGRWQHFNVGGIDRIGQLVYSWKEVDGVDDLEITKRLFDLFLVSVLLDAGAGNTWTFKDPKHPEMTLNRSEGIAVASLVMFAEGGFSNDPEKTPFQVNGTKLSHFQKKIMALGMQANDTTNIMEGLEGRTDLMVRLGQAINSNSILFGDKETSRPSNLIDYLLSHESTTTGVDGKPVIQLTTLWDKLMEGLSPIWPEGRIRLGGLPLGDAWVCSSMPQDQGEWAKIVPFHKLTQWLCYSLLVPMKKYLGATFVGEELQTGLPEYRNGGLLVDFGVLTLKPEVLEAGLAFAKEQKGTDIPLFTPDSDVIVEWRALTVGFLDYLLPLVNKKLGLVEDQVKLNLPQLLEAGTWKAGREIAAEKRPDTKGPPIDLLSDGTVF